LPAKIPQLDRLRGLAILLVLFCHVAPALPAACYTWAIRGWIGVDLFFVLSGFLITGILLDTRDDKRYFGRFYGRRVLRIWPAYTLLLVFAFCVIPLLKATVSGLTLQVRPEPIGLWAYLLMIQNFFAAPLGSSVTMQATWSLAIEEQFYLVWPVLIRYAPRWVVLSCLLASLILAPCIRIWAMSLGVSQIAIYMNPFTHGEGLLYGALVAICLRVAKPARRTMLYAGVALFSMGLVLFVLLNPNHITNIYNSPFVFTSVALFSTGLLLVALVSENLGRFLHRFFFMNRTLLFLGFISYSLYLYHGFVILLCVNQKLVNRLDLLHDPRLTEVLMVAFGLGLSILLAWISRITIERTALSWKSIFG
jgi:peptidoglycan/LPS O-acetylase OafA/YrhL